MNRIGKAFVSALTLAVLGLVALDPRTIALADTLIRGSQIKSGTVTSTQLNTSGVTAASYGTSTAIPTITVDAAGRITAASNTSISGSLLPASVTKGNLIAANGSAWTTLGVGSDGQVVTADSTQTLGVKWATASGGGSSGGGGGSLVLLESHTASSSATLDFTSLSSTYDDYVVSIDNIIPATASTDLQMQVSSDGGATYISTTSYQWSVIFHGVTDPSAGLTSSASASSIPLATGVVNSAAGINGSVWLYDVNNASSNIGLRYFTAFKQPTPKFFQFNGTGWYTGATVVNGLRFKMSSGNLASGKIRLYGVVNAASGSTSAGGALVLVEQHTASSSASLAFTQVSSTYDEYVFEMVGITPATNNAVPQIQVSTDGGATYDTGSNYAYAVLGHSNTGSGASGSQATTFMNPIGAASSGVNTGVAGSGTLAGHFRMFQTSGKYTRFSGLVSYIFDTSFPAEGSMWTGSYLSTTAVSAVRLAFSTGNIAAGTIRMYGVSKVTGAGAGAAGKVLLEQHTAAASASLDFTTCISSSYDTYDFELVSILPTTNDVTLRGLVSTNAGSTWDTSAVYARSFQYGAGNNTTSGGGVTGAAAWDIGGNETNVATGALSGRLTLYNPSSTAAYKLMTGVIAWVHTSVDLLGDEVALMWKSTTAVNAVQFKMSSGTIASGTIRCYGIGK